VRSLVSFPCSPAAAAAAAPAPAPARACAPTAARFPATTLTPCCLPHAGGEADVTAWYESVKKRLEHDRYVASLTDSGAHLAIVQDGTGPTSTISFWGRDRKQGSGGWPLEFCVQKQARDPAYMFVSAPLSRSRLRAFPRLC